MKGETYRHQLQRCTSLLNQVTLARDSTRVTGSFPSSNQSATCPQHSVEVLFTLFLLILKIKQKTVNTNFHNQTRVCRVSNSRYETIKFHNITYAQSNFHHQRNSYICNNWVVKLNPNKNFLKSTRRQTKLGQVIRNTNQK